MAGQRRSVWASVSLFLCLLRPGAAFLGGIGLRRGYGFSANILRTADRSGSRGSSILPRPEGVGGLRAAIEVDVGQELEIGSVLVAGADNYGHMTFKVCFGLVHFFNTLPNKTEFRDPSLSNRAINSCGRSVCFCMIIS